MANYFGQIDLTKISKELGGAIENVQFKDGIHKVLKVDFKERKQPSEKGHTHYLCHYDKTTKKTTYFGDFKESTFNAGQQSNGQNQQKNNDFPW